MAFRKFETDADVVEFARQHSMFFADSQQLVVSEIGDGNINFVYRVADEHGNSLIIKQALPYIRIIGEGWPLSQDRIRIESEALQLEGKHCPDLVPEVYHYDPELCAIVMEDIGAHENLRHSLIARQQLPSLAEDLGRFLADSLFFTSDLYLTSERKKELVSSFINPELCKITEELFFWDPYCDHERNAISDQVRDVAEGFWSDTELKLEVAKLKANFLSQPEAMLHGDLHSGSVFASENGTKVIDPEFAYYGPIAFDVGSIIGNLLLNYAGQSELEGDVAERKEYQQWLLGAVGNLWQTFASRFADHAASHGNDPSLAMPEYTQWKLAQIFVDTLGYAGTEMIRRTIGLSHVADIESIADAEARGRAERLVLKMGAELIKQRTRFADVDALTSWVAKL